MYNGMITVYKEPGFTSNDVIAKLRGILHMKKIGHTGTLDPQAEGVLPVCLGNATKLVDLIADTDKEYRALLRLGVRTDTQDMSGKVLWRCDEEALRRLTPEKIRQAARGFTGQIEQIPPMYSALKVNGRRLYELARQGKTVERKARTITIYELEIEQISVPLVTLRVRCSKGTYIRTLCEDLGTALGVGGAMEHLLRTRVGTFTLKEARTLSQIEQLVKTDPGKFRESVLPVDSFFKDRARVTVPPQSRKYLVNGNALYLRQVQTQGPVADGELVRVYDRDGTFYALYRFEQKEGKFSNVKMFPPTQ